PLGEHGANRGRWEHDFPRRVPSPASGVTILGQSHRIDMAARTDNVTAFGALPHQREPGAFM
ncbi:MAG: hypothetical protein ACREFP_17820, partial [Acetobacteraceae bacterium]